MSEEAISVPESRKRRVTIFACNFLNVYGVGDSGMGTEVTADILKLASLSQNLKKNETKKEGGHRLIHQLPPAALPEPQAKGQRRILR